MKKKKIKLLVASMAVAAILVGGSLAWFQFHQSVPNHFTTGSVKTDIIEHFNPNSPEATNMQPGVKVQKEVTVKNLGKSPAIIRVKLDPEWDAKGKIPQESAAKAVTLDTTAALKSGDWIKGTDGYYYYTKVVAPGASTTQLLNNVMLNGDFNLTNDYQDRGLTVNVTSDAIQATGGAWKDAWDHEDENGKGGVLPEDIVKALTNIKTTNVSTENSTEGTNGSTVNGENHSDAQTPLASQKPVAK